MKFVENNLAIISMNGSTAIAIKIITASIFSVFLKNIPRYVIVEIILIAEDCFCIKYQQIYFFFYKFISNYQYFFVMC